MRYVYGIGSGIIRFSYRNRTLFMKDIYNCQIDLSIVKRTAGSIDKLVVYNVEQTAQHYNISKEKLPFIKECFYLNKTSCTSDIFSFDKIYTADKAIMNFNFYRKNNNFGQISEMSNEDYEKYLKLIEDINFKIDRRSYIEYQYEDLS